MNDASVTLSLHWAALIGRGGCVDDATHTKGCHGFSLDGTYENGGTFIHYGRGLPF